jgi:hypothetical protein
MAEVRKDDLSTGSVKAVDSGLQVRLRLFEAYRHTGMRGSSTMQSHVGTKQTSAASGLGLGAGEARLQYGGKKDIREKSGGLRNRPICSFGFEEVVEPQAVYQHFWIRVCEVSCFLQVKTMRQNLGHARMTESPRLAPRSPLEQRLRASEGKR